MTRSVSKAKKVLVVFGTRPELIKLYPVIQALRDGQRDLQQVLLTTAQHREMLDQLLTTFQITPDFDLNIMRRSQSLTDVTAGILQKIDPILSTVKPDLVIIQGDTSTVFSTALAAFYRKIPVAHIEAGLRSGERYNPFPEEINRVLCTRLAALHFAPTDGARQNLLREGIPSELITVTGNTVIDTLRLVRASKRLAPPLELAQIFDWQGRTILVTAHRRESWGEHLQSICAAVKELVERHPDVQIVWPLHPNPVIRETVTSALSNINRIHLIPAQPYDSFVRLMEKSDLLMSDSGGIQEEAPALGKMLVVLRTVSDRPEALARGLQRIGGYESQAIVACVEALLAAPAHPDPTQNPYGDGVAAARIIATVRGYLGLPVSEPPPAFDTGQG